MISDSRGITFHASGPSVTVSGMITVSGSSFFSINGTKIDLSGNRLYGDSGATLTVGGKPRFLCGCSITDQCDACSGAFLTDTDSDDILDCVDQCPGAQDVDSDSDGALDCDDECPANPQKTAPVFLRHCK